MKLLKKMLHEKTFNNAEQLRSEQDEEEDEELLRQMMTTGVMLKVMMYTIQQYRYWCVSGDKMLTTTMHVDTGVRRATNSDIEVKTWLLIDFVDRSTKSKKRPMYFRKIAKNLTTARSYAIAVFAVFVCPSVLVHHTLTIRSSTRTVNLWGHPNRAPNTAG